MAVQEQVYGFFIPTVTLMGIGAHKEICPQMRSLGVSKPFIVADKGITVPLLTDPDLAVISAYGVAMEGEDIAVPAIFIVDGEKTILWQYIGEDVADRPSEEEVLDMAIRIKTTGAAD